MKTLFVCLGIFLFSFIQTTAAQDGKPAVYQENASLSTVQLQRNAALVPYQLGVTSDLERLQSGANKVQIQQIGHYNYVQTKLFGTNSNLEIIQRGNENSVVVQKYAREINQRIEQLGNNNSVLDFGSYTGHSIKTDYQQRGNNQSITSFGTNSISKDMQIKQSGNGASLVIINH